MIDPGKYMARAVEAALGLTAGGKDQIAVSFELLDAETNEPTGERITWYGYFTDATTDRTIQSLKLCGWNPGPKGENWPTIDDLHGCGDNVVELEVEHDTYNGVTRAKVKWINRPGNGGMALKDRMDEGQQSAFAKRMRAAVLAFEKQNSGNGNGGVKPAAKPAPKAAPKPKAQPPMREPGDDSDEFPDF